MPPRVTWLLPVRNGEQYLERTLISIAEQDYPGHAHTVYAWDDGSSDSTPDLLRKWIGRELPGRIVSSERVGLGRALAQLTVAAQSELIARIDADDIAEPDRIRRQVEYLCDHRKVGVLGTQMKAVDSKKVLTNHPTSDADIRWALRFTNPVAHPTVMLRRSAVLEAGNYRDLPPGNEDYDLWVRMALIVRFATLDQPLVHYRIHEQSVTAGWKEANGEHFYRRRNALIDRLLPGVAPSDAVRLLDLIRRPDDLNVTANDLVRFRHAAMLAAKACRYAPTYFTSTPMFKQQYENLKTRRLKGQPFIRPVWPILKHASKLIHKQTKPTRKEPSAA
ncbi:MAG: glycosyltransferase [Phycisphaeraceae bacterium]|nr:glycosyltransferase [Phycisphaeraceae bacterium]